MSMNDPLASATTARTNPFRIRVLVLMGVCGSGKTAVGKLVADRWGASFEDADDWHTPEAVAKMAAGIPLTDEDRIPWLNRLREEVIAAVPEGSRCVLACSALRRHYRDRLREGQEGVVFVYLEGSRDLIARRLGSRTGHYMPPTLLDSQLASLEAPGPEEAITVSIEGTIEEVTGKVLGTVS